MSPPRRYDTALRVRMGQVHASVVDSHSPPACMDLSHTYPYHSLAGPLGLLYIGHRVTEGTKFPRAFANYSPNPRNTSNPLSQHRSIPV